MITDKVFLSGSYSSEDVIFLLKEITGLITEQSNEIRENAIGRGVHYSEMLPIEYHPTKEYMDIFYNTLEENKNVLAGYVAILSERIINKRGNNLVLVSLARAGTPIGILVKRYIELKYNLTLPHYSISIIRDKGIDKNALFYIFKNHPDAQLQFIDGWTGKGVIQNTLIDACEDLYKEYGIKLNGDLAVLSDPAHCSTTYATREDFLIPSACLNSTVSGLMSRTVCSEKIISKDDFHGAKFYKDWADIDVSNFFIDTITEEFGTVCNNPELHNHITLLNNKVETANYRGLQDVAKIQELFKIDNINLIKPGVGETTRVLLRRIPWKVLVDSTTNPNLKHIIKLAEERNVPIEVYKDMSYSCCGIIKSKGLSDL
ncbi:cysteine protease StiP family protein [uncultured Clostridium sp.]|uniref:cysteine protease StiP family protein n=1 Tax=uncultured Clostridium sp. TaxID=59620 RepID=UPI0028F0EA60|nr:cysteine protease StiP family protein [uncultured Clostridium sp.]